MPPHKTAHHYAAGGSAHRRSGGGLRRRHEVHHSSGERVDQADESFESSFDSFASDDAVKGAVEGVPVVEPGEHHPLELPGSGVRFLYQDSYGRRWEPDTRANFRFSLLLVAGPGVEHQSVIRALFPDTAVQSMTQADRTTFFQAKVAVPNFEQTYTVHTGDAAPPSSSASPPPPPAGTNTEPPGSMPRVHRRTYAGATLLLDVTILSAAPDGDLTDQQVERYVWSCSAMLFVYDPAIRASYDALDMAFRLAMQGAGHNAVATAVMSLPADGDNPGVPRRVTVFPRDGQWLAERHAAGFFADIHAPVDGVDGRTVLVNIAANVLRLKRDGHNVLVVPIHGKEGIGPADACCVACSVLCCACLFT